jgi:ribonuclease HI
MSRLNWNRPRRLLIPWYERDLPPEMTAMPAPRVKPRARASQLELARPPVKTPTLVTGAFTGPPALRTWDLVEAKRALCMAREAIVFCDGGCSPNPGTEGMGVVIVAGGERFELYGGGGMGTNNTAELGAAMLALEAIPMQCRAVAFSDSQYLVRGVNEWIPGWRRKDFMRGGAAIPNAGLWRALDALNQSRSVQWNWVRGHNGNPGNLLADQLATFGRSEGSR